MKDTINILCAADDAYVPYYGIMLTSLFENNKAEHFEVFMLTSKLGGESCSVLRRAAEAYANDIHFVSIDESLLADCPIRSGDHVTLATYYRLIAARVLPGHIGKILWLDGDMIVNASIRPLWETDISGFAFAAVTDESFFSQDIYHRLLLDTTIPYTSAGVLLINLTYWRSKRITDRFLECIRDKHESLLFHDQDILNIVLQNEKKLLPLKWNFQSGFITSWKFSDYPISFQQEILDSVGHPCIIHYSGPTKPWVKYNLHPFRSFYQKYKSLSLWRDVSSKSFGFKQGIMDWIGKALRISGLRPSSYIIKDRRP